MKKTNFKKFISVLLPLCVALSAVGFGAFSAFANETPDNGASLTVGKNIVSNYYIDTAYYKAQGCDALQYTYNGTSDIAEYNSVTSPMIQLKDTDDQYVITAPQAAAQITEPTEIKIYKDGEVYDTVSYSAKQYCDGVIAMDEDVLKNYTGRPEKMVKLCKVITTYGKVAQTMFSDYVDTYSIPAITENYSTDLQLSSATYTPGIVKTSTGNIRFASASFMCTSSAALRLYLGGAFEFDHTVYAEPEVSFIDNEVTCTKGYTDESGEREWYLQINNIKPEFFDSKISVAYAGATIEISVLDYAGAVLGSAAIPEGVQKDLARVLIRYNEASNAFFVGHNNLEYIPATEATCTADGNIAYYLCKDDGCGAFCVDDTGEGEYTAEEVRIPALGHSYNAVVTAPTCTAGGYTTYTCSRCGDSYTGDNTAALGHSYGDWQHTTLPTCTTKGEDTRTCSRCGAIDTQEVAIDPNNHSYGDFVDEPVVAATCTTEGSYDVVMYCSACGYRFVWNTETTPALGHSYGDWTVTTAAVAPTCTATGKTAVETKTCSRCGDMQTRGGETVAATGHTPVADAAVAATCTATGLTAGSHCSVCNTVLTAQTTVPATGHSYTSSVTAPTYEAQGYTTHTCSNCGASYKDSYTAQLVPATFSKADSLAHTDTYLYRAGNSNAIKLGTLFKVASGSVNDSGNVEVAVTSKDSTNTTVAGTFTKNTSDWTQGTVKFTGEGVAKVSIKEGSGAAYDLYLEVIAGKNVTAYSELATGSNNVNVLLSNIALSNGANPGIYSTIYGNGFTIDASKGLTEKTGIIILNNGKLDNCVINGPTMTSYVDTFGNTGYASTVCSEGDGSVITNCRITGGQSPLRINSVATVKDTVISGGYYANVDVRGGEATFENVTTVNTQNGLGIAVANGAGDATKITINGTLTQHNFISQNTSMGSTSANTLKNAMFNSSYSKYQFTSGGTKYVNTGIVSLSSNFGAANITDNRTDKKNYSGMPATITIATMSVTGYVYTMENTDASMLETSYTEPAYTPSTQKLYEPSFTWALASADNVAAGGDTHCYKDTSGVLQIQFLTGGSKTLNVANLPTVKKYSKKVLDTSVTCAGPNGTSVTVSGGNVTFNQKGEYTLTYTYTDDLIFNEDGTDTSQTETYTKTIKVNVAVKKAAPNATITSSADTGTIAWGKAGNSFDPDYNPCIPFLDGLTITDYDANGDAYTVLNGSSQASFINSISSVSVSGTTVTITLANGCKLVVKGPSMDGPVQIKVNSNKMYYCDSTADNNPAAFTKSFAKNSYTYTGENGVAVSYGTARSFTSTTSTSTIANYSSMTTPWTSNKFLMYDAQGGTVSPSYASSSPATLPTPTKEGYTFLNWNTKADGTGTASNAGTSMSFSSTTTLYAIWAANVTVSFDKNGGSANPTPISGGAGTTATLPSTTFSGNWLEGWYTAETGGTRIGAPGASFTIPASDTTYYAHWSPSYTVTYNANGGTVGTAYETYMGTALTLPAPTNGAKTFEGWYTAEEGGTKIGAAGDSYVPTANITLYAQWSDNILVTFDGNSGTAGTNSDTYDKVTPITLPTATWAGHQFNGWYTAASGGEIVGDAGAEYVPTEPVTLYAQWTAYTVTYDANSGSVSPASASADSNGTVTLPTPTRTGYTFNGWYTATSGGTKYGNGGASYTPTANITMYAQWTVSTYKVTITTSKSSTAVTVNGTTVSNGGSVAYNSVVKVVLAYEESSNQLFTIKQGSTTVTRYSSEACSSSTTSTAAGTYYFKMPAGDVTIDSSSKAASSGSCIAPETLITLADGTQKRADALTGEEEVLVWNFETGTYDTAPFLFIDDSDDFGTYNVVHLYFSDGTESKLISEHGYFDVEEAKYVYITEENYRDYIGDHFVKIDSIEDNTWTTVTLVDSEITEEEVKPYGPTTQAGFCFYVDGMLSMPGGVAGMFNIFDVDTDAMTYDFEALQADIETYGLYTYDEFADLVSEEVFEYAGCAYLKVAVGKGLITWDEIVAIAERYAPFLTEYN